MKSKLIILLTALAWGCGTTADPESNNTVDEGANNGKGDITAKQTTLCVGVRGNGERIFSHFGALARIHETYGPIDAIAGGSSASITSFLTESIYMNPALWDCNGETCSDEMVGKRAALMLKSVMGYLEILSQTDEAAALFQLKGIVALIQSNEASIDELLLDEKFEDARTQVLALLQNEEITALINPEIIDVLTNSKTPQFHTQDIWGALKGFGSFSVDSDLILIRPSVISFQTVAQKMGRIGTFYAAMGPDNLQKWDTFLNECAEPSAGKSWSELETLSAGEASCTTHFRTMAGEWRAAYLADEANQPSRLDDQVGSGLAALVSTSVITGDSVAAFNEARAAYLNGAPISLDVDFNDVKFGYWGQSSDLETVAKNGQEYTDLKTEKFLALGAGSWRTALSLSPAEPGLSRALEISDTMISAGGWSDLAPSTVLKNLNCDEVILVTREGEVQGGFGPSVASLLGMDDDVDNQLYDLDGDSAVKTSLNAADGVWCTNWDGVESGNFAAHFADAYNAPFEAKSDFLAKGTYSGAVESANKAACTAGVAAQ